MTNKFSTNQFIIEQLEQRLMFSADFEPIPLDGGLSDENIFVGSSVEETLLLSTVMESRDALDEEVKRNEIIFIDASIPDHRQLVDDLLKRNDDGRQIEVVVLDISRDGVVQISETLTRYQDIDAVHVVSHGSDGSIQLGNALLTGDSVDTYADAIEGWGNALTGEADLLFYGCNLAAGDKGQALIDSLTFLTGADVAASTDSTGHTLLGGDWELEYTKGILESKIAIRLETQADWQGVLATTTIGDSTAPANKTVGTYQTNNAVSAFTLSTDSGIDTLTDVTVTFSGTNVSDVVANGVKIWQDNGTVANEWDTSDTLISTASFSGTTANFTGLSVNVTTSATQYLFTYDVAAGVREGNTLEGSVTAATVSNTLVNNDNTDATLTYDIDWYNPSWNYRKEITFDPSMTSNTDQYYFPVLVKLASDAELAASAGANSQPNGDDILFTLSDGVTKLDHEIETFVDSTGELWAWVEVPVLSSSVDTTLYMYYGNSGAANQQNIPGTWNEGGNNNYKGVWHLDEEEAGTGTTPPHQDLYQDSSGNGNNGDDLVSDTLQTGQISSGQKFDGVDDYIDAGNDPSLDITSQITFSAWTQLTDAGAPLILRIISNKVTWDGPGGYEFTYEPTANTIHVSGSGSDTAQGTLVADTNWHYLAGVINGTTATIYVDGVDVTTNSTVSALASGTDNLYIGDQSGGAGANYKGFIDEARISSIARSADWIKSRFNNENTPGTYIAAGAEESQTTFIDNGATPADRNVWAGGYQFTAGTFTLSSNSGNDNLTDLTVTFSGTDVNDVRSTGVGGVSIWRDDGLTPDQWDINDTRIGSTVSFSGNTASFAGLGETIYTTSTQYFITYNIDGSATVGNTLQGYISAATTDINPVVSNDTVDTTLTVEAGYVHETSAYKFVYGPGIGNELYLKNTSLPDTNILQGMSIGSIYSTGPASLLMTFDPDATVTSIVNNSSVEQVQMNGNLMDRTGVSYGTVTADITFYEDRFAFDLNVSVTSNPSGADWLFMSYATWGGAMDLNFLYSGNSNPFSIETASYTISGQSEPISYQTLFEMGATDGLISATLQHDGSFASAGIKNIDNGGSYDAAFQKDISAAPLGNFNSSVMYSFGTTTSGLDSTLAEERRDDFFVPATLDFTILGNDGTDLGYVPERGVYTMDDNDADDHVRFEFQPTTNHHAPAFEITNWDGAAPIVITIDDVVKEIGTDYNAAVTGTTLYLQYLGDVSANAIFEIGDDSISGTVYSDESSTPLIGTTVRMLVNGVDAGTTTTDASGRYAFFQIFATNDTILVYLDDDVIGTDDGTTVTVIDGDALTGLDIYVDHLITRHDNAGVLSNALMDTALGAYSDTEILYSVSGGNLTVSGPGTELYVASGHSYTPGGNVLTHDIKILGTITAEGNTFSISGNWDSATGTFTYDSSTVTFNAGTTGNAITSGSAEFYDIEFNSAAGDWTLLDAITAHNNFTITDTDTSGNGVDFNDQAVNVAGDFTIMAGNIAGGVSTFTVGGNWDSSGIESMYSLWNSTVVLTGTGTVKQRTSGGGWNYLFGSISLAAAGQTTTVTSSNLWTANQLTVGSGIFTDGAGSSTVYLQGVGDVFIDGGATITVQNLYYRANAIRGALNVVGRDYTGIANLGFYGVGSAAGDNINSMQGNIIANNIRIWENNSSGNRNVLNTNDYDITANNLYVGLNGDINDYGLINAGSSTIDINGNIVIYASDGSGDNEINASSSTINVSGNWTNNDTFTAGTSSIIFDGGDQTISGSTTFYDFTKTEASNNATDVTLTFDNISTQTINGTFTLNGLDGDDRINLVSDSPGIQWDLVLGAAATTVIDYVDVTDSDASGSDAGQVPINPTDSINSGNTVDWFPVFSGTVYNDEGVTPVADGTVVRLLVNGVDAGSGTTTAGAYSIFPDFTVNAGDAVLLFIDNNDGTINDGTTVTVTGGQHLSGLDIYVDHLITRHDNGGSLTNAMLDNAKGAYVDTEILYSLDGSDNLTAESGTEIFIANGHTYSPGANVITQGITGNIDVRGTLEGGSNTFIVSGSWDSSGGTWNTDTSTVNLTGTGTIAQYTAVSPWAHGFNNLSVAAAGESTTLTSNNLWVNQLTTGTGVFTDGANSYSILLQGTGNVLIDAGATLTFDSLVYRVANNTQNVVGRDYSGINYLYFDAVGNAGGDGIYSLQGNIIANNVRMLSNNGAPDTNTSILNTNNFSLTATNLSIGNTSNNHHYGRLNAGSSTITINGDVEICISDASGANEINAGSSTWNVSGNWTDNDVFNYGTSTVNLTGSGNISGDGGNHTSPDFYNLTLSAAGETTTMTSNTTVTNQLTLGSGNLTDGAGTYSVYLTDTGTPLVNGGASVSINSIFYRTGGAGAVNVAGGNYGTTNVFLYNQVNGVTYDLTSAFTGNYFVVEAANGTSSIFDTQGNDMTVDYFGLGPVDSMSTGSVTVYMGAANIDIGTSGLGSWNPSWASSHTLNLDSATINSEGDWILESGAVTIAQNAGTSTVILDGGDQAIYGSGNFYNLTKTESIDDSTDVTLTFDNTATQTITGTLTLDGLDDDDRINLVSDNPGNQWSLVLGVAATAAIDYMEVTDSDASGSAAGQKPINPANSINGGNTVDWFPIFSGTVYSDEGVTPVTDGTFIRLVVNGVDAGSATTTAGAYSITPGFTVNAGDAVLLFIDNNDGAVNDGTTVTVADGDHLSGLDIYVDHLITRHDNAGTLTNAILDSAKGAYVDGEILYTVDGSDNLTAESDAELFVAGGHSYNPGADVTTQGSGGNMDVRGTLTGGTSIFTVSGDWDSTAGTFTGGSSTLVMTGSSNDISANGNSINDLTIDPGATITARNTFNLMGNADLTISGTFNIAAGEQVMMINPNSITINVAGELGGAGTFIQRVGGGASVHTFDGTISVGTYKYNILNNAGTPPGHILTGATYGGDLEIVSSGNTALNYVYISGGDLNVGGTLTIATDLGWFGPITTILNNAQENRNVTVGNLVVGNAGATDEYGQFIAGSGNIDVNGDVIIYTSDGSGTNQIDAGSSTWNVSGNWTNYDSFIAGTSTVILDGGDQAINGSTTFNNLIKSESSNDATDVTLTVDNTGTQTINGTFTLDGLDNDDRINLVSDSPGIQWDLVLGAAATTVIDYVDVTDSDASGSDAGQVPINPADSINSGNTVDWFPVFSGTVYNDEGVTPVADGTVVRLLVNGVDAGSGTTTAGAYSIFPDFTVNAGDAVLLFIDNNDGAINDGTTVTVTGGQHLSGLDIYVDHLITRHDNGGSLTNAMLDSARGAYVDTEILYTVDAGDNLTAETGTEIFVASGHTYDPGANVTTQGSSGGMDVRGTLTGGTSTITVSGDWDSIVGTFNYDTSEVVMTGAANDLTTGGDWFHKLTIDNGAIITAQDTSVIWSGGTLTISGTFDIAAGQMVTAVNPNDIVINPGGELGGAGTFKQRVGSGAAVHSMNGTISVATYIYEVLNNAPSAPGHILTGANYGGDLLITLSGNTAENWVYIGGGDLTVGGTLTVGSDRTWFGPFTAVLNNAQENRNVTVGNLVIGNSVDTDQYGLFIAGSGNIDVNGDVTILASDAGGTNEIDAGSSTWNVSGNWTNNDTFTAGTSTVIFDGGDQAINGSTNFNNFTKIESTNDATDITLTFDNTGTQTINGTITLDGLDADDRINLVSDSPGNRWDIVLGASANALIDFIEVTDSDASGSDGSHLPIEPSDSLNGGNTISWFNTVPTIGGTVAGQAVNDNATVSPFSGVTIGDVDNPAQTLTVSVTLDDGNKGAFTTLNGFIDAGGGVYTFSGTAAAATAAIQGMVYDPADNRVAPALTETTTFTISVDDGIAAPVTDNTTTVISTSMNDIPAIGGTVAGQAVNDNATVSPFSGVTIGDVDNPAQTLTISVTLDDGNKGAFTTLSGFTDAGGGVYTFSGTAAAATAAIQGMVYDPADNRVAPALTETTTFTISVDDGSGTMTDNTTTVISTSMDDAPTAISLDQTNVDENAGGSVVGNLTTIDADAGDAHTYTVDDTRFEIVAGQLKLKEGQSLDFETEPTVNITVTSTDTGLLGTTRIFTITVNDLNESPSATNLNAPETYAGNTSLNLTDIIVSDIDSPNITVTLTLSDAAAGSLSTGTSGSVTSTYDAVTGVWTASGSIDDVNMLLADVTFNPAVNYISDFAIAASVDDGVAAAVTGMKNMNFTVVGERPNEKKPGDEKPDIDQEEQKKPDELDEPVDENTESDNSQHEGAAVPLDAPLIMSARENASAIHSSDTGAAGSSRGAERSTDNHASSRRGFDRDHAREQGLSGIRDYEHEALSESAQILAVHESTGADLTVSIGRTRDAIESIERREKIITKTVVGVTLSVTAGFATWVLRAGSLIGSAITSMPLWKGFDALPVLSLSRKERRKKIREVRNIEEDENKKQKDIAELLDAGKGKQINNGREADKS